MCASIAREKTETFISLLCISYDNDYSFNYDYYTLN